MSIDVPTALGEYELTRHTADEVIAVTITYTHTLAAIVRTHSSMVGLSLWCGKLVWCEFLRTTICLVSCLQPEEIDDMTLGVLVMRKTLAIMQVITLWQCGGSFHCLPRFVVDGKRKR